MVIEHALTKLLRLAAVLLLLISRAAVATNSRRRWLQQGDSDDRRHAGVVQVVWNQKRPQPAADTSQDMLQLIQCINTPHSTGSTTTTTWQTVLEDQLGVMHAVAAWWDKAPPRVPLTVVTTANMERLNQLRASCISWPGPYSVVMYEALHRNGSARLAVDNEQRLDHTIAQVSAFVTDMQQRPRACQPSILLVYELFSDADAAAALFPYNTLRNLARLQVRTPLMAMVDVDLLLSRSLYTRLSDTTLAHLLINEARQHHKAFIIPAFNLHADFQEGLWAESLANSAKSMASDAFRQGILEHFSRQTFPVGHNLTHYDQWLGADRDYETQYQYKAEPWLVVDSVSTPWHDARYRGYGMDKVQHIAHMNASGFSFWVLHDAFTIHRPHHRSHGANAWAASKAQEKQKWKVARVRARKTGLFTHNMALLEAQVEVHKYQPVLSQSVSSCLGTLPWWTNQ